MEKYSQFHDRGSGIAPFVPVPSEPAGIYLPLHVFLFLFRLPFVVTIPTTYFLFLQWFPLGSSVKKAILSLILSILGIWWIDLQIDGVKKCSLSRQHQGRVPSPSNVIASSFTSPIDSLYLGAIFDPIFTVSYPHTRQVEYISLFGAMLRAFSKPKECPSKGAKMTDLKNILAEHPQRVIVVYPECTTTNGRGILPLCPSLLTASAGTKIFPMSLRYSPAVITTPVPEEKKDKFLITVLDTIGEDSAMTSSTDILGSIGEQPEVNAEEMRVLDKVGEALARLGRVKRVGLTVKDKAAMLTDPQVRKIVQVQNSNLPGMLYRGVLQLLRPRLDVGYRRLEWQCNCGMPLYGDFRGDDEEVDKLVMDIQAHGFLVMQSGHGAKRLPAGCRQTTPSNSASPAPASSSASEATRSFSINITSTTSQVVGGMPNPTDGGFDTAASQSTSASVCPKFVALCVNSGPFQKIYNEIDISSISKDTQMFHNFKRAYEACRSSRTNVVRSWLTKPVDIKFTQFAVEGLKRVYPIAGSPDCTICAHTENKDDLVLMRRYEPHLAASALAHPPIPSDLFFHLWECPGDITSTLQTMWLNRLPKKLDEKLETRCLGTRADGEVILGLGILVIEGMHKRMISRLTASIATLAIIISVAYSAGKKDVSSGFAIGALVVACWTVFITALYFEFQES